MTDTKSPWRRAIAAATSSAVARPWAFLLVAALLTAGSVRLASGLEIRSDFAELLPSDVPSVAHIKEMVRRVGGDGSVLVVLENQGPEGLAASKKLAPRLAEELLALGPEQVRSVQWNVRQVEAWFSDHWPLFASVAELTDARDAIRAEVKKRVTEANPLAVDLDDDPAPAEPKGPAPKADGASRWLDPAQKLPQELVAERFARYDDGFLVHPDKKALVLNVRPAGTSLGVAQARALLDQMQKVIDRHQAELQATHVKVGFGGSTAMFIIEYEAITGDVFGTAALCFSLVILSILLFYRSVRATAALGLSILVAVAITFGLTSVVIGYLNTQTAFLGVIVAGNGINYGLIYLARVQQLRRAGVGLREACVEGAETSAQATLLASAATSVSFGVLIVAANRGFRHFGFIGGLGMLLCWICTFALVPAILSVWERLRPFKPGFSNAVAAAVISCTGVVVLEVIGVPLGRTQALLVALVGFGACWALLRAAPLLWRQLRPAAAESAPDAVPGWMLGAWQRPQLIIGAFALLTLGAAAFFLHTLPTAMERNLDNLSNDPLGGETRRFNDLGQACLGKSIAGTLALLESREEADLFCDQIRKRMEEPARFPDAPPNRELIDGCETISAVVPRFQEEKLRLVGEIRAELSDRLLGRLTPAQADRLRLVRAQLEAQTVITAQQAPGNLIDPFRERDGQLGRLAVVTARPLAKLELGPNLKAFVAAVRDVPVNGRSVEATGSNVIFNDLLENIDHEGPRTTLLSFLGVCVLVLIYFRNLRTAVEVLGTLFIGVVLMAGVASALHYKINFFNFIVFPITFGIAVDYGANVAARVRERNGRALVSLVEVGPAVALCSWTSVIGYASLLLSINRALRSFGEYGMIGEFTSILTALVLLPALLVVAERARARAQQGQ